MFLKKTKGNNVIKYWFNSVYVNCFPVIVTIIMLLYYFMNNFNFIS